jgi:hypothetical protein
VAAAFPTSDAPQPIDLAERSHYAIAAKPAIKRLHFIYQSALSHPTRRDRLNYEVRDKMLASTESIDSMGIDSASNAAAKVSTV